VAKDINERGIGSDAGETLLSFFVELNSLEHAADIAASEMHMQKNEE